MKNQEYLKISIVIVNYNLGDFLEACIQSVIIQNYPNLEIILVDGGSTDNSLAIIEKYKKHFTYWVSESDNGQYHAIQKGFEKSTGDIMAWLNSDDKYLSKSLYAVASIFTKFPEVNWLMGLAREYTEEGILVGRITAPWSRWSRYRYYTNDFQFIQQESSFWTRKLWEKSGATLNTDFKLAADMELWSRFFRHAKLHTTIIELAGFRHRKTGQRSKEHLAIYLQECNQVIRREQGKLSFFQKLLLPFMYINRWIFGPFFFFDIPVFSHIYAFFFDIPKLINYDFETHQYVRKNILIKHPPMVLGKLQIHRKVFKNKE